MALIKKYNAGGKADFRKYMTKKLLTDDRFSASEQEQLGKELHNFTPPENLEDAGSTDDSNEARSRLNEEYKKYKQDLDNRTEVIKSDRPHTHNIQDIFDHIVTEDFGGNTDNAIRTLGNMTDNNRIKQMAIKRAKELVNSYMRSAHQDPDNKWNKKDEVEALQNVLFGIDENKEINDEDWNKVVDFSNAIGWEIGSLVRSPGDLEEAKRLQEERDAQYNLEKSRRELENLGLSEEDLALLDGFSINRDYEPFEDYSFLQDLAKEKGYTIISSPNNEIQAFIDSEGNIVKNEGGLVTTDQLNPHYGKTWTTTDQGGFHIYSPEEWESNQFLDLDSILENDPYDYRVGREILTDDPKFAEYTISGYSGDNYRGDEARDIFGRRIFNKKFKFTKDGKDTIVTQHEDGKYRTEDGKIFDMPKNMRYGENLIDVPTDYEKKYLTHPGSPLERAYGDLWDGDGWWSRTFGKGSKANAETINSLLNAVDREIKDFIKEYDEAIKNKKDITIAPDRTKKVAQILSHVFRDPENVYSEEHKERAEKLTNQFAAFANKQIYDSVAQEYIPLFNTDLFMKWRLGGKIIKQEGKEFTDMFKDGGILKFEEGGSSDSYLNTIQQLASSRVDAPKVPEVADSPAGGSAQTGYRDITGTIEDANALDWISTAASVASFVPVLGIAGGAVSTVADATNALYRGNWDRGDTFNLLSNIGFTALAAVGLGAAKGVRMAGQAGRSARKLGRFGKTVDKLATAAKSGKLGKAAGKVATAGKSVAGSGKALTSGAREASRFRRVKSMADIALKRAAGVDPTVAASAKKIQDLAKTAKTAKDFNTAIQSASYAKDVANVANMATKVTWAGRAGQGLARGAKQAVTMAPTAVGKSVKYGLGLAQIGGGVKGAVSVGSNIAREGLVEGIKQSQVADVRNLLQTSALGLGYRRNVLNRRALDNRTKLVYAEGESPTTNLRITNKEGVDIANIPIENDPNLKDFNPGWFKKTFTKGKNVVRSSKNKTDLATDYKERIKNLLPSGKQQTVFDAIDAGHSIKVERTGGEAVARILKNYDASNPKELREMLRAKRVLETNRGNVFTQPFRRWDYNIQTEGSYTKPKPTPKKPKNSGRKHNTRYKKRVPTAKKLDFSKIDHPYKRTTKYKNASTAEKRRMTSNFRRQKQAEYSIAQRKGTDSKWLKELMKRKDQSKKLYLGGSLPSWEDTKLKIGLHPDSYKRNLVNFNAGNIPKLESRTPSIESDTSLEEDQYKENEFNWRVPAGLKTRIGRTRIGDDINFDTSYKSYFDRQARDRWTTDGGLYIGGEEPKYKLDYTKDHFDSPVPRPEFETTVRKYGVLPNDFKPKRDYGPALEFLRKEVLNRANIRSADAMIAGTRHAPMSWISRSHYRTSTPYAMFANRQANSMRSLGDRLSRSTADINSGASYRLDAEQRAQDAQTQAQYKDIERNDRIRNMQMRSDSEVDRINTQIYNQNLHSAVQSANARDNIRARLYQQQGANDGEWLRGITQKLDPNYRYAQEARNEYMKAVQDPNIQGYRDYYTNEKARIAEMGEKWAKYQDDLKERDGTYEKVDWRDSDVYDKATRNLENEIEPYRDLENKIRELGNRWQIFA